MKKREKETKTFKKNIFLMTVAFPPLLAGCNTMEGAGADIQNAGKALEQSAERNKESSPPCPSRLDKSESY